MPSLNVTGAAARLLAFGTNTPGRCLEFVWLAISQGKVHYISGGAGSAYETWQATDPASRHLGDRNVPKDMPAFFGPRPGNPYGDVIISNGDGTFTATDRPNGHVGICTLNQRGIQVGRPFLGWAETMGGYTLTTTNTAGTGSSVLLPTSPTLPPPPKRIDMTLPLVFNVTDGGLAGVYLTLNADGGYVYPAAEVSAAVTVAAPVFNNSINSDGNKIGATENGVPVKIRQENLHIILQGLGYRDAGTIIESVATSGGGFFDKVARTAEPVETVGAAIDLTPVLDAIKAIPAAPRTFVAQ